MKRQGGKNLRGNLVLVSHCSLEESEAQKGVHLLSELRGTEQVCGTQASSLPMLSLPPGALCPGFRPKKVQS